MNTYLKVLTIFILSALSFWSCKERKSSASMDITDNMTVWADTIIYEILISNPDTLNEWETTKLKYLNHQKLIDNLFEMIYTGKKKAYHYYTNKPMDISAIKDLENNGTFTRDKIGKLQFTETWIFNKELQSFKKQIHSILLAYEIYDDHNNLRGYKAAFYLKFD